MYYLKWSLLLGVIVLLVSSFLFLYKKKSKGPIDLTNSKISIQGEYKDEYQNSYSVKIDSLDLKSILSNVLINDTAKKYDRWQVIHTANQHGKISITSEKYHTNKLPIPLIELLIAVIILSLPFIVKKAIDIYVENNKYKHIRNSHSWLLKFGLTKIHVGSNHDTDFDYYIKYLELLTKGFVAINENNINSHKIIIKLFYPGTLSDIVEKYNKPNVKLLYNKWNELAKDTNFQINRFFVAEKKEFVTNENKSKYSEYMNCFPDIKPYYIDKDGIPDIVKKMEDRFDLAIFQCASEYLCIGFNSGEITYVDNRLTDEREPLIGRANIKIDEYGDLTLLDLVFAK